MRYQIFFFYLTLSLITCCLLYKCAHHCSIYLYAFEDHVMAGWFFVLCFLLFVWCDRSSLFDFDLPQQQIFVCEWFILLWSICVRRSLDQCFKQASRAQNAIFINWPIKKYWMILLTQFIPICERIASNTVVFSALLLFYMVSSVFFSKQHIPAFV